MTSSSWTPDCLRAFVSVQCQSSPRATTRFVIVVPSPVTGASSLPSAVFTQL